MPQTRKAFHFDLDTKKLEANNAPKDAWNKVRKFLEGKGFEHVQYSGYESKQPMKHSKVNIILENLQDEFPWFVSCAKDARVTSIVGRHHDALAHLQAYTADKASSCEPDTHEHDDEQVFLASEERDMRAASELLGKGTASLSQTNKEDER